ncbi:MAG: hypothetical protein ACP5HU_12720, partial [Phycisphaerae bacterium]
QGSQLALGQWVGPILLALGWWRLRTSMAHCRKLWTALAVAALAVGVVQVLWKPEGLQIPPGSAFLVLMLIHAFAYGRLARSAGMDKCRRAWRLAFWSGAVIYGVPLVVALVFLPFGGPRYHYESNNLILLGALLLLQSLPFLLWIRAVVVAGRTSRPPVRGKVLRFVGHPIGLVLVVIAMLLPLWLMIPLAVHHHVTPTWEEFIRDNHGKAQLLPLDDGVLAVASAPGMLAMGTDPPATIYPSMEDLTPEAEAEIVELLTVVELYHGDQPLVELELVLQVVSEKEGGTLSGAVADLRQKAGDNRFQLVARALIEPDWQGEPRATEDSVYRDEGSRRHRFPVRLEGVLASGAGEDDIQLLEVAGLRDAFRRYGEGQAWGLVTRDSGPEPALDQSGGALSNAGRALLDLLKTPDPPPYADGMVYEFKVDVILDVFVSRRARLLENLSVKGTHIDASYEGYSYRWVIRRKASSRYGSTELKSTVSNTHSWNGKVW